MVLLCDDALCRNGSMVRVTSREGGNDFALRTVATRAVRFHRHEHVRCFAALARVMANIAVKRRLVRGIDLMFGVIEIGLRHPAID